MLLQPSTWIHRRVETLVFIDDARVRRRVSVDFTVPDLPKIVVPRPDHQGLVLLPIALLDKRLLRKFDLTDQSGMSLSAVTEAQKNEIGHSILRGYARRAVYAQTGQNLDEGLVEKLAQIVKGDRQAAVRALKAWNSQWSHQAGVVWKDNEARTLMQDLARNFVLFVPLAAAPGDRRLIKFSYEQSLGDAERLPEAPRQGKLKRHQHLQRALALRPWDFAFDITSSGQAAGYHIELEAPVELVVAKASLERWSPLPPTTLDSSNNPTALVHLNPVRQSREVAASFKVQFALRSAGLLVAALMVASLTSAVLLGGLVLHLLGVAVRADAAGPVVVVLPAVVAPFVAIPGAHRLVQRIVLALRVMILASATISFAAAASLIAAFHRGVRPWIWFALFVISCVPTILLAFAWRRAKRLEWTQSHADT